MAAEAPEGLSIRVLGELSVARNGLAVALPPSKKTRALLAYLVLTQREHRRDRLCSLFWDVTDDPRGALRWSVSKLRALCDEPNTVRIVADRDSLSFQPCGAFVDLLEVRALASPERLGRMSFDELEALVQKFRGELLTGLSLEDFDEFQSWCVAEREQARLLHAGLLRALLARSPSPERSLPHARSLVRIDSLNQGARAALIELLGRLGLGQEVEQQYQAGRRLLAELGAQSTHELDAAYRSAKQAATERATASAGPGPTATHTASAPEPRSTRLGVTEGDFEAPPASRAIPFVGRARECTELGALFDEAKERGRARVALLSGEAGVGKSRILHELASTARHRGATLLFGQAYEVESGRPYGPWIDALRQIPRSAVGSRLAEELAVLVPEWAPGPAPRRSEEQLFGAVSEIVAARAHSAPPVVIWIDDVHWLDEPSSRLLHYVARLNRHRPVLTVLAARDGELFDNQPLARTLRSLRRDGLLHELSIGPLGPAEIEALAAHLAPGAEAQRIFAESAGNPLFAIELFRAPSGSKDGIPGTLSALIRDRVEGLPQHAADALRWAAVLGPSFAFGRLEALAGLASDELANALEILERHALIHPERAAERGAFAFAHEVVRRAIYADISEPRRRLMHRRVAESLQPLLATDETLAADVVHHAALAGQPEVSARACLRAAERCVKLFAGTDAEALVRRGFYHAQKLGTTERIKLELELWRVQLAARRPEQSEQAALELQRLGELALDHGFADYARLAFHMLSWLRWEEGASSDAMAFSLRAEELSRDLRDDERINAMAESARCLLLVERDLSTAEALLLEAQARAERSQVMPVAIPDALGMLAWHRGDLAKAAELFKQARQIARRDSDRSNEFQALEHELCVLLELGQIDSARAVGRALADLGEKLRGGSEAPAARVLAALLDYRARPESAEVEIEAALDGLRAADAKQRLAYALTLAAEADLDAGRLERAGARAEEALAVATALSRPSDVALTRALLARVAPANGNHGWGTAQRKALMATPLGLLSQRARRAVELAIGPALTHTPQSAKRSPDGTRRRRAPLG